MAFLSALLAQSAGAADQKGENYKEAVAHEARLDDLTAQQKEDERRAAESDRDFKRATDNDAADRAAGEAKNAAEKKRTDTLEGVGIHPPAGFLKPNRGQQPSFQQMAINAHLTAAWYRTNNALDKADDYDKQAMQYETMANNNARNDLGQQKENALEDYRRQTIQQKTALFNSRQQQQFVEFTRHEEAKTTALAQTLAQRGQIATMTANDRIYIAQLAAAERMRGVDEETAARRAISQWTQENTNFRAQGNSLNPAFSSGGPYGGPPPTVNYNFGTSGFPMPTAPVNTIPNANGAPPIPANPNEQRSGIGGLYGGGGGGNTAGSGGISTIYGGQRAANGNAGPPPTHASADLAVSAAVQQAVQGWKASGATAQTLPTILKSAYPQLSDQQRSAIAMRVLAQLGIPLPLGAGGMRAAGATAGTSTSSAGGAAPANPFPQLTQ